METILRRTDSDVKAPCCRANSIPSRTRNGRPTNTANQAKRGAMLRIGSRTSRVK